MMHELSPREKEVAHLLMQGMSNVDIADTLHVAEQTVKHQCSSIYTKLDVSNRTEAVVKLLTSGENEQISGMDEEIATFIDKYENAIKYRDPLGMLHSTRQLQQKLQAAMPKGIKVSIEYDYDNKAFQSKYE